MPGVCPIFSPRPERLAVSKWRSFQKTRRRSFSFAPAQNAARLVAKASRRASRSRTWRPWATLTYAPVTSSPHSPRRLRSPSLHLVPPWRSAVRALNGQRSATAQAKRGWSTRRGPRGLKSAVRRRDTCSHRVRDALLAGTECKHQFPPVPSIDPLRSHILTPPSRTSASVLLLPPHLWTSSFSSKPRRRGHLPSSGKRRVQHDRPLQAHRHLFLFVGGRAWPGRGPSGWGHAECPR